jgi:hypothetical protein
MVARLGNVLYWLCCILAVVTAAVGAFVWFNRTEPDDVATVIIFTGLAAIAWRPWLPLRSCWSLSQLR